MFTIILVTCLGRGFQECWEDRETDRNLELLKGEKPNYSNLVKFIIYKVQQVTTKCSSLLMYKRQRVVAMMGDDPTVGFGRL